VLDFDFPENYYIFAHRQGSS